MSATTATLRAMRERLGVKERWTTHCLARDTMGRPVKANDPAAVCWCLDGAALVEVGWRNDEYDAIERALTQALASMGSDAFYYQWQDRHTHAEMLHLIDRAIELTEAAQ